MSLVSSPEPKGDMEKSNYAMNKQGIGESELLKDKYTEHHSRPVLITEPTLRDMLTAVQACNNSLLSLTSQMLGLKGDIAVKRQENQKICETTAIETRVGELEDSMPLIKKDLCVTKTQIKVQTQIIEGLENRQRRNNVRILGLPEHEEGQTPVMFFEKRLMNILGGASQNPLQLSELIVYRVTLRHPEVGLGQLLLGY